MNLDKLFRQRVQSQPEHPAIFGHGVTLTYQQLDAVIEQQSVELQRAGIGPGECVGLHCASGLNYLTYTYAAWRLGACVVPVPVELARCEKEQILAEIALRHLISDPPEPEFAADFQRGETTVLASGHTVREVESPRAVPAEFAAINAAFIRFTSGTTGNSKGVVLSHETIHERIEAANEVLKIGPSDNVVWLLSMSYHFAVSIVAYLSYGASIILPRNVFAGSIINAIKAHNGTLMYGSPLHYAWLKDFAGEADLSSLRLAISTTSPIEPELARAFERRYSLAVTQALGIIEVGLPCINLDFASEHPDAIGCILPAYEVNFQPTEMGSEFFELRLRGPGMLDAYYHPWRPRAEILQDGWFVPGDIVTIDAGGCLRIRGRSKDVINIAGMKFFPQETERVLSEHPSIEAARVFPVRDPRFGEAAHAEVIAKTSAEALPTPEELAKWCQSRLAPFKVPTLIQYVSSFPRTASGKVLHRAVS